MKTSFDLTTKKVTPFLLKIVGCLMVLGTISNYMKNVMKIDWALGFIPMFDLNNEYNPPAFYSALAIWFSAALLWCVHIQEKKTGYSGNHWKILCFIFAYLGLDELSGIHECFARIGPLVSRYIHLPSHYLYWVVAFGILMVAFAAYFFKFYWRLPGSTRLQLTIAGLVYVGGAVGMELVGGWYEKNVLGGLYDAKWYPQAFNMGLLITIEEGMEMIGIVLFIRALLIHLRNIASYPRIDIALNYDTKPKESARNEATLASRKRTVEAR